MKHLSSCVRWRPGRALAFLLALAGEARPDAETVRVDLVSESVGRRLPFDVPFVLEGDAPPGTSRVEMQLRWKTPAEAFDEQTGSPHAVSGTDSAGRFRLQVLALPADRDVRFDLVLERSLTENGRRLFRQDTEALLRREMASGRDGELAADARLSDGIRVAFTRALAEGRAAGAPRGDLTLASPAALFDAGATPEQVAEELALLSRDARAARSGLEAAVRRQEDTVSSLIAALAEIQEADALAALIAGLQARPELDPRNPSSPLALSEEARALALGEEPPVPRILGAGPAEVAAARSVDVPFEAVAVSSVVVLELGATSAPADGATVTNAIARVAAALPSEQRTVTFSTTAGTLAVSGSTTAQVRAGTDDLASVGLVSPRTTASAVVTASVNNLTARRTVEFTHAYPDDVSLAVQGSFRLTASFSTKATLRAELSREVGSVTRGTEVRFTAVDDSTGQTFGFWSAESASDLNGLATAEFTPGNTTERGEATIRVSVPGTSLSASVKVEIVSP